jgi:hypothetical protein
MASPGVNMRNPFKVDNGRVISISILIFHFFNDLYIMFFEFIVYFEVVEL